MINTSDQPIKYDALIGDGILREVVGESDGLLSAYNAVPIQAVTTLAMGALIPGGAVAFNGTTAYKAVTGRVRGSVRFDHLTGSSPFAATALTLLTLDVNSNRSNYPTFVDLNFYNESEVLISTFWEFVCWTEVGLSTDINPNLTDVGMGSKKGLVVSGQATKQPINGIANTAGPVTLLGIVETAIYNSNDQSYSYSLYNDSTPVPTAFIPND